MHTSLTRKNKLQYQFYAKHHATGGRSNDAQWGISNDDEFKSFDLADERECVVDGGHMFGVLPDGDGLTILGTRGEQVAKFPCPGESRPWHGYPLYPILKHDDSDRKGYIPHVGLKKLHENNLITRVQLSRLRGGNIA
jgi:hypothetical protein